MKEEQRRRRDPEAGLGRGGRSQQSPRRYDPLTSPPSTPHKNKNKSGPNTAESEAENTTALEDDAALFAPCFVPYGTRRVSMFVAVSVLHILIHGGIVVVEVLGPIDTSKFGDTDLTWMRSFF